MADNGQDPVVSGAQKVSKAANTAKSAAKTVKTVGKAAAKAAAQNYVGAIKDLVTDPEVFRKIISIVLVVCFIFVFILMAVGAAIVAILNWILNHFKEVVGDDINVNAFQSGGNLFSFYTDSLGDIICAIPEVAVNMLADIFTSDEDGDGKEEDQTGAYQQTVNAAINQEDFVGEDGAISTRLEAIKTRVKERGEQIALTFDDMKLDAMGLEIAAGISNGLLYPCLYAGVDGEMEVNCDKSAFNLTDIQALKILAAYCAQNECSPGEADIWDLYNYIGWFEDVITDIEDDVISQEQELETMTVHTSVAQSVLDFASIGDIPSRFDLSGVQAARWHGTFKPQWWKEEWDQLLQYYNYYTRYGNTVPGNVGDCTGNEIADAIANHMEFSAAGLDKMGAVPDAGLVEYIYTVGTATLSISAVTYEGSDAELREAMNDLLNAATNAAFDKSYYELVSGILNSWIDWTSSLSSYGEQKIRSFPNAQVAFSYKKIDGKYDWTTSFISLKDTPAGTYCIVEMSQDPNRNYNFYSANGKYAPHLVAQMQGAFYSGKSPIWQHGLVHTAETKVPADDISWEIGDPDYHYTIDKTTGERVYDGTYWVIYYCPCLEVAGYNRSSYDSCVCGSATLHNNGGDDCEISNGTRPCQAPHTSCAACHTPCSKGFAEAQANGDYTSVTFESMGDVNAWHSSSCFVAGHAYTDPDKIEQYYNTAGGGQGGHQWEVYALVNAATPDLQQEDAPPPERTQAYKLKLSMDVAYSPVSIDYLTQNVIGLWPGDLDAVDEVISSNGKTTVYAANHIGNQALLKSWTEKVSVNPRGTRHQLILSFERKNGYQYEYYIDYLLGIAAELGIETDGLLSPVIKWGDPIAQIAQKEYTYMSKNQLYGGDRYWGLCSAGQTAGMKTANRQSIDDWTKGYNSWTTAFVLACAFQACETGIHGGFGNLNQYGNITNVTENKKEEWPISPKDFSAAIKAAPGVKRHTDKTYAPIPGDIVIFDTSATNDLMFNKTWRVGIVVSRSGANFTAIVGDVNNQLYKYTGNYAVGSAVTLGESAGLKVIEYWTPKYTSNLFKSPSYLKAEIYDVALESLPVSYAKALVTPTNIEYLEPKVTYLFGYPRFRWDQLPDVVAYIDSKYPQEYTEQLRAAIAADNPAWAVTEWGKLFSSQLSGKAKDLQIEIWQELYFKPFITSYMKMRNKFNWGATNIRQDLLMALLSTTDNHTALKNAIKPLIENLSNDITDAELLTVLMTDDALRNALREDADYLWPSDTDWIREEWLECIRCVLNTLAQQANLTMAATP